MNNEDKKLQKKLVDEMMKVSKTNPDVMIYMQSLMKCYEDLEKELDRYKNNWEELKEDITHLLDVIKRNEENIKIFQDEWLAIRSLENKMKELEEDK